MVSPRKSASSVNLIGEEYGSNGTVNKLVPSNRKSSESLYSTPSSRASAPAIYRPKMPSNFGNRQPAITPATTEVQKRVISARRLRFRTIQNQLGLAQHKITELSNELRVLRNLHKRQDSALAKYESTNAELPRLLHSHAEELRVWQTKYRTLQVAHKELEQKLKQKEALILTLGDENKYYSQLNKDKNLEDRQRLAEKLQSLETRLQEKENQMKLAERRSHLEIKNLKQQLLNEQKKTRDVLQKLEKARLELSNYQKLDELNITEKLSSMSIKQSSTKIDLKLNSRASKEKPYGSSIMNVSKTPSPALDALAGEDDDSDFLVSHRSQKSTSSSLNVDFSTTRTLRPMPLTIDTKHGKDINSLVTAGGPDLIGDGPDQKMKSEEIRKNQVLRRPMKMMVDIPSFHDGADGDATQTVEDDADVILGGDSADGFSQAIDYNYSDDFDENYEEENHHAYLSDSASNHTLLPRYHNEKLISSETNYDNVEIDESTDRSKENIMNIRKQITNDFKDREAFLDTFCRQATTSSGARPNNDIAPKGASDNVQVTSRKNKLLAALKAIDDDQFSIQD